MRLPLPVPFSLAQEWMVNKSSSPIIDCGYSYRKLYILKRQEHIKTTLAEEYEPRNPLNTPISVMAKEDRNSNIIKKVEKGLRNGSPGQYVYRKT